MVLDKDKIICIGDPIFDIYLEASAPPTICLGGALNVFQNLSSIYAKKNEDVFFVDPVFHVILDSFHSEDFYKKVLNEPLYWKSYSKIMFLKTGDSLRFKSKTYNYTSGAFTWLDKRKYSTVVFSDYNRGVLNNFSYAEKGAFQNVSIEADLFIIDSKYNTFNVDLVKKGIKVWHATGSEYNSAWAENFDYVVHTNGSKPIKIIDVAARKIVYELSVVSKNVVNSCGAGDTFVAAIAAFMHKKTTRNKSKFLSLLKEATQFGMKCCSDVIDRPYTSVTKIKLR
jgi:bifunctional ADP-heptose synthase (sugar kinase/adenylyltransferase)